MMLMWLRIINLAHGLILNQWDFKKTIFSENKVVMTFWTHQLNLFFFVIWTLLNYSVKIFFPWWTLVNPACNWLLLFNTIEGSLCSLVDNQLMLSPLFQFIFAKRIFSLNYEQEANTISFRKDALFRCYRKSGKWRRHKCANRKNITTKNVKSSV